jgi:predicted kinase
MTIILTRGYPASGKTTWARGWIASQPDAKRARSNRDDLRASVFAGEGVLSYEQEQLITKLQREAVVRLVKGGYSVVIDDMNLKLKYARTWADLAVELGVEFDVLDFKIPVDQCVDRAIKRFNEGGRHIGADVIRDIAARFPTARWPEVLPTDKAATRQWPVYTPNLDLPKAYIVDIDGTIAMKEVGPGARGWHEYGRVGEDLPKRIVIDIIIALYQSGVEIIFVSGRKHYCYDETRAWLRRYVGEWTFQRALLMRGTDDNRADDLVKNEIFERDIAPKYNVLATIDDRQRVVDMWRAKGLTCLQVDAWVESK